MQFDKMTPIQKAVISYISKGSDVMGCAQTGSGKTIAFLLPIVNKMAMQGPPNVKGKKIFKQKFRLQSRCFCSSYPDTCTYERISRADMERSKKVNHNDRNECCEGLWWSPS